jgi:predicted small integral membrane protein
LPESRAEVLAWEQRWARPVVVATFASILLIVAAIVVATQVVGTGNGESELLRNVEAHRGAQLLSSILQAIGVGLLAAPLYYLFRAAKARSERMRGQLVGVVVAAPLFLAALAILSGLSTLHAASDFVSNEVPHLMAKGIALSSDRANETANDTITEAPLRPLAAGFGLGGQLGFVIAMVYTALYAMRTGLLTRFGGSLGMALGAVSFIFFQFTLLWFIYLGLLLLGFVPGGKPPAWQSGEAEPWPTPGEKAAAAMDDDDPPIEGEAVEIPPIEGEDPASLDSVERRKRKQRD